MKTALGVAVSAEVLKTQYLDITSRANRLREELTTQLSKLLEREKIR